MLKVILVVSGKGGTGKTTLTAGVGAALSQLGRRVLLIDGDCGLRNLDIVLGHVGQGGVFLCRCRRRRGAAGDAMAGTRITKHCTYSLRRSRCLR